MSTPKGGFAEKAERHRIDPINHYYRDRIASVIASGLSAARVAPSQLVFPQPFMAVAAAYLLVFDAGKHLVLACALFELRAIVGRVAAALARATDSERSFHDGNANLIAYTFLYGALSWSLHLAPMMRGPFSGSVATSLVLLVALAHGALALQEPLRAAIDGLRAAVRKRTRRPARLTRVA